MLFIIGVIVVFGSVVGGYTIHGGNLHILFQPSEFLIIGGAAIGAFLISNPPSVLKKALKSFKKLLKGAPYKKDHYVELLTFLFRILKEMKTKGMLAIEGAIEDPHASELFTKYPFFMSDHHAVQFFCDNIRLLTMGVDNHYQMEEIMDRDLEGHHHDLENAASAVVNLGDSFPALGIVAAVLGVIVTMGSISEPPEVLGHLIGAALVGTFFGILMSYGIVSPMGAYLGKFAGEESKYMECIKVAILAHMQGNAPTVTVEFVRKAIPDHIRPSFKEVEEAVNAQT